MGELSEAVAKLEEQVEGAHELRKIVERLDTEIAERMDEIESVGSMLLELHGDLDDQIAEHDFGAVEQSLQTMHGLVDMEEVLPAIDTVLLLTALRDDLPSPALSLPLSAFKSDGDWGHPQLTQADLDRDFEAKLARADQQQDEIWGNDTWTSSSERDSQRSQDRADDELQAIQERTARVGDYIRELVDYIGFTLWPDLVASVEAGNRERAVEVLAAACAAAQEAVPAYKLYEVNLSAQYERSPMSLGAMGEVLMDFEVWLGSSKSE